MPEARNLPFAICLILIELVIVHIPSSSRQGLSTRQRRQSIDKNVLCHILGRLLQELGQARLALLLRRNESLLAGLANQLDLGLRGASHRQQRHDVTLGNDAELRVRATVITLPVGVVGNITGGKSDGVVEAEGVQASGRRVSEVRVQGNTVGAIGVEGEGLADGLPQAGGLEGLFLRIPITSAFLNEARVEA